MYFDKYMMKLFFFTIHDEVDRRYEAMKITKYIVYGCKLAIDESSNTAMS
jgi:hypothetical protein